MSNYSEILTTFFNSLNKNSMQIVSEFYSENAVFFDPVVSLKGTKEIEGYYKGLYQGVEEIKFEFSEIVEADTWVAAPWIMHLRAAKLNSGKLVSINGISHVRFDKDSSKAIYHRDYFDMGAFIYEYVPVLGSVIRFVKSKLHS